MKEVLAAGEPGGPGEFSGHLLRGSEQSSGRNACDDQRLIKPQRLAKHIFESPRD